MRSQKRAGVVLSYGTQAVRLLSGLVYTPIMLRMLGQSEYGLYQLVYSVVSYLSLFSLGFTSSYIRFYARERIKDDKTAVNKLNGMFLEIFLIMSLLSLVCGAFMVINIHTIFSDGLSQSEYNIAIILMMLMVFNLSLTFPMSLFDSYIAAHECFLFQKALSFVQSLLSPVITLPILLMGYGSIGMVIVSTCLTVAQMLISILYCLKKLSMRFAFKGIKWGLFKELWLFTAWIFLSQIVDQINWNVDRFLLGRISGTTVVAIYGVGGQISSLYNAFSSAVSNVYIPEVNNIVAKGKEDKKLSVVFTKVGRIQFFILGLILTGFIFFGKEFIRFWAGDGYDESFMVSLLLIAPATIPWIQNIGIEIQKAKNMHKMRSIVYFFIAIGNVLLSIPMILKYGATGAAVGTAIALLVGNGLFMNWYYYKRVGLDVQMFWKSVLSIFPALVIPIAVGFVLNTLLNMNTIISMVIKIVIYTVVYCLSVVRFAFNEEEKNLIKRIN